MALSRAVDSGERDIGVHDIDRLAELTASLASPFSELCAANLYLFRHLHRYRISLGDMPYARGLTYDGTPHAVALCPLSTEALLDLSRRTGLILYPQVAQDGWASTYNPDDSDYIFLVEDLATYTGSARKGPRHLRRRFRRDVGPRDEPFTPGLAADVLAILDAWLADVGQPWAETDFAACREAVALFEPLGLLGHVTYARDGDPAGFVLASDLGNGSAAIHFAKGKRAYPGVFAHLFSRFAETHRHRFARLNFEQDLGKPGFRQAKRSHGPVGLLHKHRLAVWAEPGVIGARGRQPGSSKTSVA